MFVNSKKSSTFAPRKNEKKNMKKEIHPSNYRLVVFKDMSNDDIFITKSTVEAKDTIEVEGVEYPLVSWKFLVLPTHTIQGRQNL